MGELSASEYDKETSLIVLSVNDANTNRADNILSTLYDTYKEDVVENKNRVALNTAKFIDERIQIIGRELSSVESQLATFKKRNQLVDFDKTSQAVLTETQSARQQSLQAETQLNVARYLAEYLHNHGNGHDLIPALNVGDASFNQQIAAYNDQMNKRNQMAANTSEANNVVRELDRQLVQMRQAIGSSLLVLPTKRNKVLTFSVSNHLKRLSTLTCSTNARKWHCNRLSTRLTYVWLKVLLATSK